MKNGACTYQYTTLQLLFGHLLVTPNKSVTQKISGVMTTNQPKGRKRSDYSYELEYRTRWSDNDMYDHMNNSVYSFLFDSIINAYLIEHCGRDPTTSDQVGLVVHSYCDFFRSVGFPAVVDLGLRVNKLGKSSVTYEVGVFKRGDEQVCAVGGYTHVFVDRKTNRPSASGMLDAIRTGLAKLLIEKAPKL